MVLVWFHSKICPPLPATPMEMFPFTFIMFWFSKVNCFFLQNAFNKVFNIFCIFYQYEITKILERGKMTRSHLALSLVKIPKSSSLTIPFSNFFLNSITTLEFSPSLHSRISLRFFSYNHFSLKSQASQKDLKLTKAPNFYSFHPNALKVTPEWGIPIGNFIYFWDAYDFITHP